MRVILQSAGCFQTLEISFVSVNLICNSLNTSLSNPQLPFQSQLLGNSPSSTCMICFTITFQESTQPAEADAGFRVVQEMHGPVAVRHESRSFQAASAAQLVAALCQVQFVFVFTTLWMRVATKDAIVAIVFVLSMVMMATTTMMMLMAWCWWGRWWRRRRWWW